MTILPPNRATKRFLHASDLHLGTKILQNPALSEDYTNALKAILDACINFQVDFLLLGGDGFTGLEMLPKTFGAIIDLLKKFQEATLSRIPIVAIEGNHDLRRFGYGTRFSYRHSWLRVLASLGLVILLDGMETQGKLDQFQDYNPTLTTGGRYQLGNIVIYGTRYLGEHPQTHFQEFIKGFQQDDGCFRILLQHFGIDGTMDGVPGVPLADVQILRNHVNYLALGHFHKQFRCQNWVFNPGSPLAVSSSEYQLPRGVFLVELSNLPGEKPQLQTVQSLRIPERPHHIEIITIPKSIKNHNQLHQHISDSLESKYANKRAINGSLPILTIQLNGYKPISFNKKQLISDIREGLSIASLHLMENFSSQTPRLEDYIRIEPSRKNPSWADVENVSQ